MSQLSETQWKQLQSAALAAQRCAYAPYSNFQVGAAILHRSGQVFVGANVENASYGLTLCAERVAASIAVTSEPSSFEGAMASSESSSAVDPRKDAWLAIAIASVGGVTPCGACRQFLMEFAPHMQVALINSSTEEIRHLGALQLLLPSVFILDPQR